ncbi:MAG: glycosyltransferase family 39 protein [Chlamydiota bacterium]
MDADARKTAVSLALIVALGAALRLATLPSSTVWLDEANTITGASMSLPGLMRYMRTQENGPPLFQLILHVWIRLFGESDIVCALLPLIFSVLAPLAVFLLARDLFGTRAALWAAFLAAANTVGIEEATDIRHNSLLDLLTAGSYLLLFRAAADRRWFWPYILVGVLGIYEHYYFAFVLLSHLAACAVRRRQAVPRIFVAQCIVAAAFVPWLPVMAAQFRLGANTWMHLVPGPAGLARWLVAAVVEDSGIFAQRDIRVLSGTAARLAVALPLCAILAAAVIRALRARSRDAATAAALAAGYLVSIGVPILISMAKPIYVPGRYDIIGLAPAIVLFGWAFSSFRSRILAAILILFYLGNTAAFLLRDPAPHRFNDRESVAALARVLRPDDAIVYVGQSTLVTNYYLRQFGVDARTKRTYPLQAEAHPCWIDMGALRARFGGLRGEAEGIAESVRAASPRRVYLFFPGAEWFPKAASLPMIEEMEKRFSLEAVRPWNGFFYDEVRVYRTRGGTGSTS